MFILIVMVVSQLIDPARFGCHFDTIHFFAGSASASSGESLLQRNVTSLRIGSGHEFDVDVDAIAATMQGQQTNKGM